MQGWEGPWKAALTSGSLSATGDLLAQFGHAQINQVCVYYGILAKMFENLLFWQNLIHEATFSFHTQRQGKAANPYDPSRTLRMFGFGLCIYGPYQVIGRHTTRMLKWS